MVLPLQPVDEIIEANMDLLKFTSLLSNSKLFYIVSINQNHRDKTLLFLSYSSAANYSLLCDVENILLESCKQKYFHLCLLVYAVVDEYPSLKHTIQEISCSLSCV